LRRGELSAFTNTKERSRVSMKGSVKMFNKEKGYGFIRTEDGRDVFFHHSSILMDGYKTAEAGEAVTFEVEESERGPRAKDIKKL
jgi:cold shock protein